MTKPVIVKDGKQERVVEYFLESLYSMIVTKARLRTEFLNVRRIRYAITNFFIFTHTHTSFVHLEIR